MRIQIYILAGRKRRFGSFSAYHKDANVSRKDYLLYFFGVARIVQLYECPNCGYAVALAPKCILCGFQFSAPLRAKKPKITPLKNILLLNLFAMIILAGCAPDPRNQADADNSRTLTAQQAANIEQARQIRADKFGMDVQAIKAAWPTIVFGVNMIAVALALSISFSLVGVGGGVGWAGYGLGKVAIRAAEVKAHQVHADRKTRLFPLIPKYIGRGCYSVHNPNTGSTIRLDTRRAEEAALIQAVREVQSIGVAAYEFGNAHNGSDETTGKVTDLISQFEAMANRKASRHATISTK